MAELNVCPMLTAGSNAHNSIIVSHNTASGADKVINSLIDNTMVKGEKSDEDLLKGLLSDTYCHVCSSQLMSESHRLAHYEGKKHAQKVKVFLEAARAETTTGAKHTMLSDKNRFCELCNMVFSSNVVAKSHYEGKVHAKNLRKQSLQPSDKNSQVQEHKNTVQKPVQEENTELQLDPAPTPASCEVDLKDPNKYCPLCAASFNNSQMALQHYNGRKHHRNQSRQTLLKELGDDVQQATSFMCHICGVKLGSVEIYQAHLQGNKHQIRKKKISDLCKSQPKVYSTFADELADYIEVQKARGVTPKTNPVLPQEGKQKDNEEDLEVKQEELIKRNWEESAQYMLNPLNNYHPHHHPGFGTEHPLCLGPVGPSQSSNYTCPPLFSSFTQFSSHPPTSEHHRRLSGSPPYSTSSYSSYSSTTSDSDEEKHRLRGKRRIKRLKRDGGGDEEMDMKRRRRRKRRRRERDSEEKKREPSLESEEEEQRKTLKSLRCEENESQQENFKTGSEKTERETLQPEHVMGNREETGLNKLTDMNADQSGNDKPVKSKSKKEKKKSKEKADTRTEEEKLWDDSILGW